MRLRKTHCKKGHKLSGSNLLDSANNRTCKICFYETRRKSDAKAREKKKVSATPNYEVKAIRKQLNFTQNELAIKLGVQQTVVSEWESGKRLISSQFENLIKSFKASV